MCQPSLDKIAARINRAANLSQLAEALCDWERAIRDLSNDAYPELALDSEGEAASRGVDFCQLPTYGPEPKTTREIWSWDEYKLLTGWSVDGAEFQQRIGDS